MWKNYNWDSTVSCNQGFLLLMMIVKNHSLWSFLQAFKLLISYTLSFHKMEEEF